MLFSIAGERHVEARRTIRESCAKRQLREENAKLKRVVADLTLDKHILAEIVRKKSDASTPT